MKLWATGVSQPKKFVGIKALRGVNTRLGGDPSLSTAKMQWEGLAKGDPKALLLLQTDDMEVMRWAIQELERGFVATAMTADDSRPVTGAREEAALTPDEEAEPEPPTVAATQASAILLSCNQGSASGALQTARHLSRVLQEPFWEDVATYILQTFPAPNEEVQQALLADRKS